MLGGARDPVESTQSDDFAEARRLDGMLTPIWDLFKQFSSLRSVYAIAEFLGVCQAEPPRPVLPLPDPAKDKITKCLSLFQQDVGPVEQAKATLCGETQVKLK